MRFHFKDHITRARIQIFSNILLMQKRTRECGPVCLNFLAYFLSSFVILEKTLKLSTFDFKDY